MDSRSTTHDRSEVARLRYAKRRAELVDVAARVFAEKGYHATSIDDLVEATRLKRGGLYHYIGGKKDLLLSIHERFIEPLLAETDRILASDVPADAKLRALAHVLMRTIDEYRDQVTVFLHEWRVIKDDPAWQPVRASRRAFETAIERILVEGVQSDLFDIADTRRTTLAFLGMFNYSYQWFAPSGRFTADEIAESFSDIFLRGVLQAR